MQFSKNIITLTVISALCAFAAASPVVQRDADSIVNIYSGDTCDGAETGFTVEGSGSFRCVPVSNARSVSVSGSGCKTVLWSGTNCRGDSYVIPDSNCHSILYGSVSVQC